MQIAQDQGAGCTCGIDALATGLGRADRIDGEARTASMDGELDHSDHVIDPRVDDNAVQFPAQIGE